MQSKVQLKWSTLFEQNGKDTTLGHMGGSVIVKSQTGKYCDDYFPDYVDM